MKKVLSIVTLALAVVAISAFMFACVPDTIESAKTKMGNAGYAVAGYSVEAEGVEGTFTAVKLTGDNAGTIFAVIFDTEENAKKFYDAFPNSDDYDYFKQNGKWVYFGSEAAIKVFEG